MPTPLQHPARRVLAFIAILAAVCAGLTATAPAAHAETATPVYSGTGWKAWTSLGIYSINPDPYTVVFADTTARSMLTNYLTGPAAQISTVTGVPVTVSTTIDTTPVGTCPPRHRIVVHYEYRPTGVKGMSEARACYQISDRSAWGGHVRLDSEYWTTPAWFSTNTTVNDWQRRQVVAHELAHTFGLAHPNQDLDHDGLVENGECVRNSSGVAPVMCANDLRYVAAQTPGRYVDEYDVAGLRQMAWNWYLRQT